MAKWIKANFPGVRYRKHPTRKYGVKMDQYFTIRYKLHGKDKEEGLGWSSEGWSEKKAYGHLAKLKESIKTGEGPQTLAEKREIEKTLKKKKKEKSLTFEKFFLEIYLPKARPDKKAASVRREEGFYRNWFEPVFGHIPMQDISPFHVEKLKKNMADQGQSNRSIVYALAVCRQVFHVAGREGYYTGESPTTGVKKPKVDNARMRFLTHEEATRLLEALKVKSPDVHDMTLLSLHAGLRFGEITSLTWQDVDLEKGILTIRDAKAGSRYAFLTDQAVEMIRNRRQGGPSDYVFPKRGGGKIDLISRSFFRTVKELDLNKGIEDPRLKICFHSCRHSYAAWMIEQGADLYIVQKLLGHKTNTMTQRYAHMSESRLRDATKALGQAWQNQSGKDAGQVLTLNKKQKTKGEGKSP